MSDTQSVFDWMEKDGHGHYEIRKDDMNDLGKLPMLNTLGKDAAWLIERAEAYEHEAAHLRQAAIKRIVYEHHDLREDPLAVTCACDAGLFTMEAHADHVAQAIGRAHR